MPDFKPKVPVQLNPPKDDPISLEELAKADGESGSMPYIEAFTDKSVQARKVTRRTLL